MIRPLILLALATAALASTSTTAGAQGITVRGSQLAAQICQQCHMTGLPGPGTDIAPSFRTIIGRRSPDYIRGFLANPHVRDTMPPFELSPAETEDIISFMEAQNRGSHQSR